MRLETLLPRPLDPCGGSECATLMGALIAAIHLDRRRARALGWRGRAPPVRRRPHGPAVWPGAGSCSGWSSSARTRTEAHCAARSRPTPSRSRTIPSLSFFRREALRLAVDPGYGDRIRALSGARRNALPIPDSGNGLAAGRRRRLRAVPDPVRPGPPAHGGAGRRGGFLPAGSAGSWSRAAGKRTCPPSGCSCARSRPCRPRPKACLGTPPAYRWTARRPRSPVSTPPGTSGTSPAGQGGNSGSRRRSAAPEPKGVPSPACPCATSRLRRNPACPCSTSSPAFSARAKPHSCGNGWISCTGVSAIRASSKMNSEKSGLTRRFCAAKPRWRRLMRGACAVRWRDSLRPGLLRLIGDMPAEQFILETTGLANPANVMEALSELRDIVQPGLVITVADALDLCRSEGDIAGIRRAQAALGAGTRDHPEQGRHRGAGRA